MEPLKPEVKVRILSENPQASPEDINEYERLLSERFTRDPSMMKSPADDAAEQARKDRIAALHEKLFRRPDNTLIPEN